MCSDAVNVSPVDTYQMGGKKTRRMQEKEVKKRTQKGERVLKEMAIKRKKEWWGKKREIWYDCTRIHEKQRTGRVK